MKGLGVLAGVVLIGLGYGLLRGKVEERIESAPTTSSAPAPATSATKESAPSQAVIQAPGTDPSEQPSPDLKAQLDRTHEALPRISSLKGMKEEEVAHRAPPQVVEAGAALGELAEYLERRPSEFKSATPFYARCARDEQLLPAARALCLHALSQKPGEWARGVKESVDQVPPQISEIASEL